MEETLRVILIESTMTTWSLENYRFERLSIKYCTTVRASFTLPIMRRKAILLFFQSLFSPNDRTQSWKFKLRTIIYRELQYTLTHFRRMQEGCFSKNAAPRSEESLCGFMIDFLWFHFLACNCQILELGGTKLDETNLDQKSKHITLEPHTNTYYLPL